MKIASARGESDSGARTVQCEDEPEKNENGEENNYNQEYSTARHLEDSRFVCVPDAEADAEDGGECLQALMNVSQFS